MKILESLKSAFCGVVLFRLLVGVFVICGIAAAQERSTQPAVGYEDSYQIKTMPGTSLRFATLDNPHVTPSVP
jgi:hypothetical protein